MSNFRFPPSHHLNIVTKENVYTWSKDELCIIYSSESRGISAARESSDESGTLVIADSFIILLRRVEKDQEKSHTSNLQHQKGEIALLKFSADGKQLYFTSRLSNCIQSYSLADRKLSEVSSAKHPSCPTCIAVSPKSHIFVTSSQSPPVTLLKYRQGAWNTVLTSSRSAVSVITFHPNRSHIFLLGFTDGSVALFDAHASNNKSQSKEKSTAAKEIVTFKNLHTEIRSEDGNPQGVIGIEFISSAKNSVVTVGFDGICSIIDFDSKKILKSWNVKAPATSLSVLNKNTSSSSQQCYIAVGRIDGQVKIFSKDGVLLAEKIIDQRNDQILSLEWILGKTPKALESIKGSNASETEQPVDDANESSATVRHNDVKGSVPPVSTYMDLFSPIKKEISSPKKYTSRNRPRVTSKTFSEDVKAVDLAAEEPTKLYVQPPHITPKQVALKSNNGSKMFMNIPSGLLVTQNNRLIQVESSSTQSSSNAEILARLRALSNDRPQKRKVGETLSNLSSVTRRNRKSTSTTPENPFNSNSGHQNSQAGQLKRLHTTLRPRPEVRHTDEADIWLTDDDELETRDPSETKPTGELLLNTEKNHFFAAIHSSLYDPSERMSPLTLNSTVNSQSLRAEDISGTLDNNTITSRLTNFKSPKNARKPLRKKSLKKLAPGFAESYHGPVEVDSYLPRSDSLYFRNEEAVNQNQKDSQGHLSSQPDECDGCFKLRQRVELLETQLAELKLYINYSSNTST